MAKEHRRRHHRRRHPRRRRHHARENPVKKSGSDTMIWWLLGLGGAGILAWLVFGNTGTPSSTTALNTPPASPQIPGVSPPTAPQTAQVTNQSFYDPTTGQTIPASS